MLEIGKLEGVLEAALRDPRRRQATINAIALRVVDAIERGLEPAPPGAWPLPRWPWGASAPADQLTAPWGAQRSAEGWVV
jgi:hypothetical protein